MVKLRRRKRGGGATIFAVPRKTPVMGKEKEDVCRNWEKKDSLLSRVLRKSCKQEEL